MLHSNSALIRRARIFGIAAAALTMAGISLTWLHKVGEPSPPAMSITRFSVAILAGSKQAAQTAPKNVESTAEQVVVTPTPSNTQIVEAQRSTALPDAVAATPDAMPSAEVAKPVEVIPPARVAMPGGRLSTEDAPVGDAPDPFAVGPAQVYIRLLVDENGRVVRGGIVRGGRDPVQDVLIYKSMASRQYEKSKFNMKLVQGGQSVWQLDLVINYGTQEFIP
jgi:hypothetical protein